MLLNNTGYSVSNTNSYFAGNSPISVVATSYPSDAIYVACQNSSTVSILTGSTTGSFGTPEIPVGNSPSELTTVVLTSSGFNDLVSFQSSSNSLAIDFNQSGASFPLKNNNLTNQFYTLTGTYNSANPNLLTADLNRDGLNDIIVPDGFDLNILESSNSAFTQSYIALPAPCMSLIATDINGDNYPDLISLETGGIISVMLNNGHGGFSTITNYTGSTSAVSLAAGDVSGDGKPDLVEADGTGNAVSVLINNGSGGFGAVSNYSTGASSHPTSVAIADVNGDKHLDIVAMDQSSSTVSVFVNNGSGGFASAINYSTGTSTTPVALLVSDINGDGKPDIVTANNTSSGISVLMNTGSTFAASVSYSVLTSPAYLTLADVNGDGYPDLIVSSASTMGSTLLTNSGTGTFNTSSFILGAGKGPVSAADLDGDGRVDLVSANPAGSSAIFLQNQGTFGVQFANLSGGVLAFNQHYAGTATISLNESAGILNVSDGSISSQFNASTVTSIVVDSGYLYSTFSNIYLSLATTIDKPLTFTRTQDCRINVTVNAGVFTLPAGQSTLGFVLTDNSNVVIPAAGGTSITAPPITYLIIDSGSFATLSTPQSRSSRMLLEEYSSTNIAGTTNSWLGKLDLTGNDLDVSYGNLATVTNQIHSGFNGGAWTGQGITSSTAATNSSHLTALGAILNANSSGGTLYSSGTALGTFDGVSPSPSDILVKYTYYGDANLDGKVDGSDYSLIDNAFLYNKAHPTIPLTGWYNGDFNYDGVINGSDYTLIDNAFNRQGLSLAAQIAPVAKVSAIVASAVRAGGAFAGSPFTEQACGSSQRWASQSSIASEIFASRSEDVIGPQKFSSRKVLL